MVDPLLVTTLTAVGLTEKESSILIALLSRYQSTASEIAELAGTKRSIVYVTLQNLKDRGFVQEVPKQKVKRYRAASPSQIYQTILGNTENLRLMLPILRGLQSYQNSKPVIEFYETPDAILSAYRTMEFGYSSRYLTNWQKIKEQFPKEFERWSVNAAHPKNPNNVKNLIVDNSAGHAMASKMKNNPKQLFRTLPKETVFPMNFGISDNTVAITNFDPLFAIVIRSPYVARCAELLFELAWQSGLSLE